MFNITSTGNLARLDGFTTAADESGYAITLIKMPDQDESTLAEAAERMLTLPVDGMIFSLNHMASDFYTFEPPQGLGTVIITMMEHHICSTVDCDQHRGSEEVVSYRRVGLWAVNKLVGEHAAGTREHVLLPGTLVERDSVRALG